MLDRIAREPSHSKRLSGSAPVTAGTLVNIRAVLCAALSDAVGQQLVPRNVATFVSVPSPRRRRPVALDDQQLLIFLDAARDHSLETLWFLVAVYGLRRAEAGGLRWDDIDDGARLIFVRQTVLDVPGDHACPCCPARHRRVTFDTPKSAAGDRAYPLVPAVVTALAEQRARQDDERALYGGDYSDHGLLFAPA